ncbi:MAG TPA: protein TolA, partial [Ottowia sp.]|nr:protein TolA [Ottowia sp.]
MNTAVIERLEFAPPPQGGFGRAFGLALAAHLLLILALTWGLRWKNEPHDLAVQAELWSPSVQQASPKAAPRPPAAAVEHQPPPLPKPAPKPEPVVKPPPSQADA